MLDENVLTGDSGSPIPVAARPLAQSLGLWVFELSLALLTTDLFYSLAPVPGASGAV